MKFTAADRVMNKVQGSCMTSYSYQKNTPDVKAMETVVEGRGPNTVTTWHEANDTVNKTSSPSAYPAWFDLLAFVTHTD